MNNRWIPRLLLVLILPVLVGAAGCSGSGSGSSGTSTPTSQPTSTSVVTVSTTPQPSGTTSPEAQVLKDYANYWTVYTQALLDRDASHLSEVMTGPRLDRGLKEVSDLLQQGRAIALVVAPNPAVIQVNDTQAIVYDEYPNRSYYADAITKQPIGATPTAPATLNDTVTMHRVDGVWKVFDSVRTEYAP